MITPAYHRVRNTGVIRSDRNPSRSSGSRNEAIAIWAACALVVIRYAKIHGTKHRPWLTALLARRPTKVAAIALANKIARTAWANDGQVRAVQGTRFARGVNDIAPGIRRDVKVGRANST